jgi:hypothetical protein
VSDAQATSAMDQLSGIIGHVRLTVCAHYQTLVLAGLPTKASADMAAEVQSTLLASLFPPKREDEDE